MKKITIAFLTIILLTGCGAKNGTKEVSHKEKQEVNIPEDKQVDTYQDDNPIKLGLYQYQNKNTNRKLLTEYTGDFAFETDIGSFETFLTQEQEIDSDYFQNTWKKYYDTYTNIDNYRIGYMIRFELNDGTVMEKTLKQPADGDSIYDYIQIYMYDDVHKEINAWYSHVTQEEYNDDVILSSIKLTGSTKIAEVKSPVTLTVFSYSSDDDFKDGQYRGQSKYAINIKKGN